MEMEVIEFKTIIRDCAIRIPEKYQNKMGNKVKVIIMSESTTKKANAIDRLLSDPIKVKEFSPLSRDEMYKRL